MSNDKTPQHPTPDYGLGEMVMVDSHWFTKSEKSMEFGSRFVGPFRITGFFPETSTYQLELVSSVAEAMLHPFVPDQQEVHPRPAASRPPPIVPEDNEYVVGDILASRRKGRISEYLVSWEGYSEKYNQWVKKNDIDLALLKEFHSK